MRHRRTWLLLGLLVATSSCGESITERDEREWRSAERAFRDGEELAYEQWVALDARATRGRVAHQRLEVADLHYRRAIELYRQGPLGVREAMQEGLALAPIRPDHYLTLARLCAERGNVVRAVELYRKYLRHARTSDSRAAAATELARLDGGNDPFPPDFVERRLTYPPSRPVPAGALWLGSLLVPVAFGLAWHRRLRHRRLQPLLAQRPDWQPTAAYRMGCLRHEFLKHRIGPVRDPLAAFAEGGASEKQAQFLRGRLLQSGALRTEWRSHLHGLERTLGLSWRLDTYDPMFRRARAAVKVLDLPSWPLGQRQARRMLRAHEALMTFDRHLGQLLGRLVHCRVDDAFIEEIIDSTRTEWPAGELVLDELCLDPVPANVGIDIFPADLRLILRNLVRNAMQALARSPAPRRLGFDVRVELEPTGEEFVVFRVCDSCPAELAATDASDVSRGLGIVDTALRRYDGSLQVLPASDGYAKIVVIRFFHSQRPLSQAAIV